jgi:hypothetical protein
MFYRRGGLRKANKALTYVAMWVIACEDQHRELSVPEFSDFWRQSRATSYRQREALTACLPEGQSVDEFLTGMRDDVAVRKVARQGMVPVVVAEFFAIAVPV